MFAQLLDIVTQMWRIFAKNLYLLLSQKPSIEMKPSIDPVSAFEQPIKDKFLATYDSTTNWSHNIDALFYDRKAFRTHMEEPKNELERQWKTRIMYTSTPRGNLVMHYDAYKEGFVYYSDQSSIPYRILNALAMKYVMMYRCRDFFMDDSVSVAEHVSPLIRLLEDEEKVDMDKKRSTQNELMGYEFTKNVFHVTKKNKTIEQTSENTCTVVHRQNKFVCMGKINNMRFTQLLAVPNKKRLPKTEGSSTYGYLFQSQNDKAGETYQEYKKRVHG